MQRQEVWFIDYLVEPERVGLIITRPCHEQRFSKCEPTWRSSQSPEPAIIVRFKPDVPPPFLSGGLYQWISSAYLSSVATAEDLGGILIE